MRVSIHTAGRLFFFVVYLYQSKIITTIIYTVRMLSFFLSVMPPKELAPFSYISPKNSLFNDKVWTYYRILVSKRVKSQKTDKTGPPTNPDTAPPQKFLLLLWYNLFIIVDEMRVKISPLLCRLGLVLRLGSVQFYFFALLSRLGLVLRLGSVLAIPVQLHSFLNCSCTADHHDISGIQIYSFKVD